MKEEGEFVVSHLVDGLIAGVLQPQVDHGVLQRPAHVELQGQVIHPLCMMTGLNWSDSESMDLIRPTDFYLFAE